MIANGVRGAIELARRGITTARDTYGLLELQRAIQDGIARDTAVAARVLVAGSRISRTVLSSVSGTNDHLNEVISCMHDQPMMWWEAYSTAWITKSRLAYGLMCLHRSLTSQA